MVRKIARRTEVNKARRSRVRTYVRKVEEAIASGRQDCGRAALKDAQPELHRAVTKGIAHKSDGRAKYRGSRRG
ncbi:MAG: 30S ribosomal protein S20 [Parvularculaceae bacterium]